MKDTHHTSEHGTYLSDEQHTKNLVEWHKRYIQDLRTMKKEEEQEAQESQDKEFSSGRRRWFNQEIQKSVDFLENHGVKTSFQNK